VVCGNFPLVPLNVPLGDRAGAMGAMGAMGAVGGGGGTGGGGGGGGIIGGADSSTTAASSSSLSSSASASSSSSANQAGRGSGGSGISGGSGGSRRRPNWRAGRVTREKGWVVPPQYPSPVTVAPEVEARSGPTSKAPLLIPDRITGEIR
jgi:hypothetical protein